MGSVDDQLDALGLDEIDGIGASFFHFVDAVNGQARTFDQIGGAVRGDEFESEFEEAAGDFGDVRLVLIVDADEDGALRGKFLSRRELRFVEGFAEVVGDAHDFSGGAHFRTEHGIDAGEFRPRKYWRLHVEAAAGVEVGAALDKFRKKFAELAASHQARGDFCERHAGGFRDIRNGPRGARVDFNHVDGAVGIVAVILRTHATRNRELNVHQSDDFQRAREFERVVTHHVELRLRNVDSRQHAGRVSGVDAGFLDVLHDAANDDVLSVGERVDVDFDGILQELVDEDGAVVGILHRLFHILHDGVFVEGDHHGAAAENVGGTDEDGESDLARGFDRLFWRSDHRAGSLRDIEFFEQFTEALAILGEIDRLGRGADDVHTCGFERQ